MSMTTDIMPAATPSSFLPAVSREIIQLATPIYALRPLLNTRPFPAGKTFVFYKQKGARAVGISQTGEGAYTVVDFRDYEIISYEPPIFTEGIEMSKAFVDTVQGVIDVWHDQLNSLARRIVYQQEKQVQAALDAAAGTTITATGTSLGFTGTEFTIASSLGQKDILAAKKEIAKANLVAEYLLINPVQEAQLNYLPHYTSYGYTGENSPTNGVVGEVENLRVVVTTVIPAGTAYVVSTGRNASGAYEPLGFWIEKSPLMAFYQFDVDRVVHKVRTYYHAGPLITSSASVVKITGMSTG